MAVAGLPLWLAAAISNGLLFLLIAGMAKFVPYVLLLVAPSMGAIFALNALQEVAYQLYRLSDASILADCIKDPKRLAVAQTQVRPPQPGPLPRR